MGPVAVYLVVKCVTHRDAVISMIIDRIRQQLESYAVSGAIVASRVPP